MSPYLWKTTKKWTQSFKFNSEGKDYSVELVRLKRFCGEDYRIYTNGLQIQYSSFKRRNGLAVCSASDQFSWEFDGLSFQLMTIPGLCSWAEYHLFIDGLQVTTGFTPAAIWRRRGWVLLYYGAIEVLVGVFLESLRYFEETLPYIVFSELIGRVLLLFGLLKIVEGLTSHLERDSNRFASVFTV